MFPLIHEAIRYLTRKKVKLTFNDLSLAAPVSSTFGLDRGTPIDRYYIERFLEKSAAMIHGRTLEIAESSYSTRFGKDQVKSYEVLHATPGNKRATIVGDLTDFSTLPENAMDCFICTQTFNFIYEVQKSVRGAHYLLKPGGVLLATVTGISQISRYDMDRWGDYWRFTTASLKKLRCSLAGSRSRVTAMRWRRALFCKGWQSRTSRTRNYLMRTTPTIR